MVCQDIAIEEDLLGNFLSFFLNYKFHKHIVKAKLLDKNVTTDVSIQQPGATNLWIIEKIQKIIFFINL